MLLKNQRFQWNGVFPLIQRLKMNEWVLVYDIFGNEIITAWTLNIANGVFGYKLLNNDCIEQYCLHPACKFIQTLNINTGHVLNIQLLWRSIDVSYVYSFIHID